MSATTSSSSYVFAEFKRTKNGHHKPNEVLRPGFCKKSALFKVKLIQVNEMKNGNGIEFVFEVGKTKILGVSFHEARHINEKNLTPGYTYTFQSAGKAIKIQLTDKLFKKPGFYKYEMVLPTLEILTRVANRASRKPRGIPLVNQLIATKAGKLIHNENLKDVKIVAGEIYRYKGCDMCQSGIIDSGNQKVCRSCGTKGGDKTGKWKWYMIFKSMSIEDNEGNFLHGAVLFNDECERVLGKTAADYLFDNGHCKRRMEQCLIGSKVNVTIDLKCHLDIRAAGNRNQLKIVASKLKMLPQGSSNGATQQDGNGASELHEAAWMVHRRFSRSVVNMDTEAVARHDAQAEGEQMTLEQILTGESFGNSSSIASNRSDGSESSGDESVPSPSSDPEGTLQFPPILDIEADSVERGRYPSGKMAGLIINIREYDGSSIPMRGSDSQEDARPLNEDEEEEDDTRYGSEQDVEKLCKLFANKIDVTLFQTPFLNVRSTELQQILSEFQKFAVEIGATSIIVVTMSHGLQNTIKMADGVFINFYTELLAYFSDVKFPEFAGKPKLFFNQFCQDFWNGNPLNRVEDGLAAEENLLHANGLLHDHFSSVFLGFPQLNGNSAIRSSRQGTLFIHFLTKVIGQNARSMHLEAIFRKIRDEVEEFMSRPENQGRFLMQVPQVQTIHLGCDFYFRRRGDPLTDVEDADA